MKFAIVLSTLLAICQYGFAQQFIVNVASETGQKFTVYINDKVQNRRPLPAVNMTIPWRRVSVKIVFIDKKLAPVIQSLELDEEATAWTLFRRNGKHFLKKNAIWPNYEDDDYDRTDHPGPGGNLPQHDYPRSRYLPNGSVCNAPSINEINFIRLKKEVSDAGFNNRKAAVIKRIFETNCLSATQVAGFVDMLSDYTSEQLEMAKLGYLHLFDSENFDEVIGVVGSGTHRKELEGFAMSAGKPGNSSGGNPHNPPPVHDNGSFPCRGAQLNNSQFNEALQSIRSSSFEQTKMDQAKLIVKNSCFSVGQIREIIRLFSFEESKLNFAKFAFDYTYEVDTYYLVNQEFSFEASKTELSRYLSERK